MNEPYLLWMNKNKEMEHLAQAKENHTKEGKNPKGEKSQGERERREKRHGSQKQQMRQHITLFLTSQRLMLESVISLKFMRWVDWAWWVSHF